jgi:hypothetical protein
MLDGDNAPTTLFAPVESNGHVWYNPGNSLPVTFNDSTGAPLVNKNTFAMPSGYAGKFCVVLSVRMTTGTWTGPATGNYVYFNTDSVANGHLLPLNILTGNTGSEYGTYAATNTNWGPGIPDFYTNVSFWQYDGMEEDENGDAVNLIKYAFGSAWDTDARCLVSLTVTAMDNDIVSGFQPVLGSSLLSYEMMKRLSTARPNSLNERSARAYQSCINPARESMCSLVRRVPPAKSLTAPTPRCEESKDETDDSPSRQSEFEDLNTLSIIELKAAMDKVKRPNESRSASLKK